ncbi:MAG TPA: O-antigen ligase family protein, partial [Phormidium sp.]
PKNSAAFKYGLLGCGVLLLFARSSSSILNSFSLTILAILLYRVLQFRIKLLIPSIILMILSIWGFSFIAYGVAETFANFFGKDLTLTGRTDIWAGVITMIKQRPEGYGIGTFWLQPKTFMMRQFGWLPPTAHNGFLELALDLGVPGLLIYCLISLRILVRAFFLSRKWNITIDSFWPFIFFFFTISSNLTESSLFGANSVFPLLFMTLYFSLFFFPKRPAATLQ